MCETRKKRPANNTITVLDSAGVMTGPLPGSIMLQLSDGLYFDYDSKDEVAYIGISRIWLEQEVKRIMAEQGFNIQP